MFDGGKDASSSLSIEAKGFMLLLGDADDMAVVVCGFGRDSWRGKAHMLVFVRSRTACSATYDSLSLEHEERTLLRTRSSQVQRRCIISCCRCLTGCSLCNYHSDRR